MKLHILWKMKVMTSKIWTFEIKNIGINFKLRYGKRMIKIVMVDGMESYKKMKDSGYFQLMTTVELS